MSTPKRTIDQYIGSYPQDVRIILQKVRETIHHAAPDAKEAIAYGIPTFRLNGNLVHFGGYKKHLGFYPAPSGIDAFSQELAPHRVSKGGIQFLWGESIPYELIAKIVRFRVKENLLKK